MIWEDSLVPFSPLWGQHLLYAILHYLAHPKGEIIWKYFPHGRFCYKVVGHKMNKRSLPANPHNSNSSMELAEVSKMIKFRSKILHWEHFFKLSLAAADPVEAVTKRQKESLIKEKFSKMMNCHYHYTLRVEPSSHFWKRYKCLSPSHTMCHC